MAEKLPTQRRGHLDTFWAEAVSFRHSVTRQVTRDVCLFTAFALAVCAVDHMAVPDLGVGITPFEALGAALGLLLVLRTNSGYDRWYEGRKLWGGIVNQSRTLAITALAVGPDDPAWRAQMVRWTAAFGHVARRSLRGERELPEVAALIGADEAARVAAARHMPTAVVVRLATLLQDARAAGVDPIALLPAEEARNRLVDHLGGCERILKTPIPAVYSTHIRRFIILFLVTLPFGLLAKIGWLTPLVQMLVAYPILGLDQIGLELQNPFNQDHLGHLPLEDIGNTIEGDLLALLEVSVDRRKRVVDRDEPIL